MSFSMQHELQTLRPTRPSKSSPPPQPMDEDVPGASMSPGSSQCSPLSGADLMATSFIATKPSEPGLIVPNPVTSTSQWDPTRNANTNIQAAPQVMPQAFPDQSSTESLQETGEEGGPTRRLKRLERNRESARLSRRRRKHYLEVLEEKVTKLANDVDQGRRAHVSQMMMVMQNKRSSLIQTGNEGHIQQLETALNRSSHESAVTNTFRWQQLNSLCLPPSTKFILWLTLQNDSYFRGGRAASERLSAARIGERMLQSGTDRVTPMHSMWPLLCNEVGLSYDQEEKLRAFQRTLLIDQQSWLNRHVAYGALKTMESTHSSIEAASVSASQRESATMSVLTPAQRMKFMNWAQCNRERVQGAPKVAPKAPDHFETCPSQHVAANLYVLNSKLQNILNKLPRTSPLVTEKSLKKLSRRPLFESLGCIEEKNGKGLSRDGSFASSGSLKRSASEMSIDDGQAQNSPPNICPEDAQNAAKPLVDQVLGHLTPIIPPPPISVPAPTPVVGVMSMPPTAVHYQPLYQQEHAPMVTASAPSMPTTGAIRSEPAGMQTVSSMPTLNSSSERSAAKHSRTSSFLPLNVVPEEMWPADAVADEFLMNLVDGDWAIGEGIEF